MSRHENEHQQDEAGYKKVDKRHSATDAAGNNANDARAAASTEQAAPEGAEEKPAASLADLDVYDVLRFAISLFAQQAWIHLGVQKAPSAEEVKVDLPRAKVAIETVRLLINQLQDHADRQEQRELERILSNLQINFVQRSES